MVTDLTDDNLQSYITYVVCPSANSVFYHVHMERFIADLAMSVNIAGADTRFIAYYAEYFMRLKTLRCGFFHEQTRKILYG